jgi:ribosomal protein S18 acetylase RimI-like enzyme
MIHHLKDREAVLERFAPDPAKGFVLRRFCTRVNEAGSLPVLLGNHPCEPTVLMAACGAHCQAAVLTGHEFAAREFFQEVHSLQSHSDLDWPDAGARSDWERAGKRTLFLDSIPFECYEAVIGAGFHIADAAEHADFANIYALTGQPRFSAEIKQSCRLGRGEELKHLLMQGVVYDPNGYYISRCLRNGPSFVLEVNGRPVSWSATHLTGTMAMIYTPPEHRRRGYARSLAAFQFDHMLRTHGCAIAHVIHSNQPSISMMLSLGARQLEGRVTWRTVQWDDPKEPIISGQVGA